MFCAAMILPSGVSTFRGLSHGIHLMFHTIIKLSFSDLLSVTVMSMSFGF